MAEQGKRLHLPPYDKLAGTPPPTIPKDGMPSPLGPALPAVQGVEGHAEAAGAGGVHDDRVLELLRHQHGARPGRETIFWEGGIDPFPGF